MHRPVFASHVVLCVVIAVLSPWAHATDPKLEPFLGTWQINFDESDKLIVDYKDGGGLSGSNVTPTISVMGLPLPSSIRQGPMSSLRAKDPEILRCSNMTISAEETKVRLDYDNDEKETLVLGDYRGRTTKLTRNKVEQKYKTTERSVSKTISIREDERLLVVVKIKHRGDKRRTFSRVFDRVEPDAAAASPEA